MKDERRAQLAAEFITHFGAMIRGMDSIFRKEMEAREVTWPQFYLMKVLERQGPMTVTEASNCLLVATPTASRMIEGLYSKGLLEKTKDIADHRVTRVRLTPESIKLVETLRGRQNEVMLSVFEGEDTHDLEVSVRSMGRYAARIRETPFMRAGKGTEDE